MAVKENKKKRLTKDDIISGIRFVSLHGERIYGKEMFTEIIRELYEYKELEEELGIDLLLLFKAMKEGVYTKPLKYSHINYCKMGAIDYRSKSFRTQCVGTGKYFFKDYGVRWALTEGELLTEAKTKCL